MILQETIRLLTEPFCQIRSQISEILQHVQFNRKAVVQVQIIVLRIRKNNYVTSRIKNLTVKNNVRTDNVNKTHALFGQLKGQPQTLPTPHKCGHKYTYHLSTGNKHHH